MFHNDNCDRFLTLTMTTHLFPNLNHVVLVANEANAANESI